jgi:hypothetical protein
MNKKFIIFHHINQNTIDTMYRTYSPVFVLSTGRAGSRFIHMAMSQFEDLQSYHEAFPNLQYFSDFAYHNQEAQDVLTAMFQAARMELILDAYNNNRIFLESNQCLVFFANVIAALYPNARFVHIIRHPGDFIRSAVMKGWHSNDSIWESGRVKISDKEEWNKLSQFQKLAWTWRSTNEYIRHFINNQDPGKVLTVRFEDLTSQPETFLKLLSFTGSEKTLPRDEIVQLLRNKINEIEIFPNEPDNMRKVKNYPHYISWSNDLKESIRKETEPLARCYNYEI